MFIKQENVSPETKLKIEKIKKEEDSDVPETPDNKPEEPKIVNPE